MSLSAAALQLLLDKGMTLADAIELAGVIEEGFAQALPEVSTGALRTRRYRDRLAATGLSAEEWRALSTRIIGRDGAQCQYCETRKGRMCCDHVTPLILGGGNADENLVCACEGCNGGKSGKSLEEWKGSEWATAWRTRVMSRDVTTPRPLPLSPQTPQTPTPTPGVNTTRARGFAEFWSAYPNKVGKRDAEKSYVAALKRVTGPDPPSLILDGVIRAQTSRKWLDGIIPNPATWLNQDRWEDQPSEVIPLQPRKAHERPDPDAKLIARHANYARAWEGSERAAGRDGKP